MIKKFYFFIPYILILILLFLQVNFLYSKTNGFIIDEVKIITDQDKDNINQIATSLYNKTTAEIAIITIQSLKDETIEKKAVDIFEKYSIGTKDADNGVLLLIAIDEQELRIEVGYGLEGILNDRKAGDIIRNIIIPEFKKGNFSSGIFNGFLEITKIVASNYNLALEDITQIKKNTENNESNDIADVIIAILFVAFILIFLRFGFFLGGGIGRGPRGGSGFGKFGGFGGGGRSGGGGASGRW
ncbi:MAG: TPM domain-containing protein [Elusimicrobiota bacterium]|jgi:uncharacterized protein|nr:TPM domain-containing protein [Elusimicrobiota bacterium]